MATRLCVKGLSKNTTEKDVRSLFSSKGEVTDVKIVKTTGGKSRQFAFVGYRSDVQASDAQKYFNNTFLDTARLSVEFAAKVGDALLQSSSHSKHTLKKLGKLKGNEKEKEKDKKREGKSGDNGEPRPDASSIKLDLAKRDFLEAMKKRTDAKFWSNDEGLPLETAEATNANAKVSKGRGAHTEGSDSDGDDGTSDSDDEDVNEVDAASASRLAKTKGKGKGKGTSVDNGELSDMDYLRSKVTSAAFSDDDEDNEKQDGRNDDERDDDDDDDEDEDGEDEAETEPSTTKKSNKSHQGNKPHEVVEDAGDSNVDSSRLFLRNLPFSCSEAELTELMTPFGPLTEVHIPLNADKASKGLAFVQFMIPEHAEAARAQLDGASFQGRVLHILFANKSRERGGDGEGGNADTADGATKQKAGSRLSSFQQKKEEERRSLAGKKDGWNAAFVRSDAVVDALADKYGIARADILNTSEAGGEMAVRLAIGEAHIIKENRDFFAAHGVDLSALESGGSNTRGAARSTTTLLVKNLPFDMVTEEVESMFTNFGTTAAFLVPPSKTVALVDFVEPTAARAAFKGLAYRRYKHTPIYLEWAPLGVIDRSKATAAAAVAKAGAKTKGAGEGEGPAAAASAVAATKSTKKAKSEAANEDGDDDGESFATLFIKNLSFATDEAALREHILTLLSPSGSCSEAGLRAVSIPRKKAPDGSTLLSMGFGFAEFVDGARAQRATERLQRSVLHGHALDVKPSEKRLSTASGRAKAKGANDSSNSTNCKLVVRNVAFQATQAELHALFSTFGSVKRVRIPKKMGGVHRGFAFVDFSTAQEARTAMASLTNTHLYGRHLVIEWAEEDETDGDLGVLRKRASADQNTIAKQKRSRKMEEEDPMAEGGGKGLDEYM